MKKSDKDVIATVGSIVSAMQLAFFLGLSIASTFSALYLLGLAVCCGVFIVFASYLWRTGK